jgi:transcription initiation factor TFIID subunit 6
MLYGYSNPTSRVQFKQVANAQSLFYIDDDEIDFDNVLNAPFPKVPLEVAFTGNFAKTIRLGLLISLAHWLAIEGVQPAIPQNPAPVEYRLDTLAKKTRIENRSNYLERKIEVKPLVKHVLSKELQLYFEKIVEAIMSVDTELRDAALESVREDTGIQQLLPYFIQFATNQVGLETFTFESFHIDYKEHSKFDSSSCNVTFY